MLRPVWNTDRAVREMSGLPATSCAGELTVLPRVEGRHMANELDTKIQLTEIKPVPVTMIGTGDGKGTGNGAPLTTGTMAATPDHQPNLVLIVISPIVAIVIRFVNLFLTTLVGLVVAGMTPAGSELLYTSDFYHLLGTCSSLSVPIAGLGFLKDLVTVFGKLEGKYPLLTGSV